MGSDLPREVSWWLPSGSGLAEYCSRKMPTLKCCWVWTYWKVQGQTVIEKVIYNQGNRETDHGISYVVFSRLRCFSDIGLPEGILGT
jgi:hypothetical protein